MTAGERVRAAGGVVLRSGADPEVLLVHRPRYDDWSLPKGKLLEGESELDGAIREVHEETGYTCEAGAELGRVRYVDARGRDKEVVYFAMTPGRRGPFVPNDEVDRVRWVPVDDARSMLTWERDVSILDRAVRR